MKRLFVSAAVLCLVSVGWGQVAPEAFLGKIPTLPGAPCGMKSAEREDYLAKVSELSDQLANEISRREQEAEAGLSDADIEKLKNMDNLSEAEQEALTSKLMEGKYNLSLDEVKKLDKMSGKGKEAWTQAYADEAAANAQANPEQTRGDQRKARGTLEATKELKGLLDRIGAQESKYAQQLSDLDQDSEAKAIRELEAKLRGMSSGGKVTEAKRKEMEALSKKIQSARKAYCPRYASRYQGIVEHHGDALKSALADYNRIDEIQFELTSMETGVSKGRPQTGLSGMKAVQHHVGLLNGAFKYNVAGD
jgi:hypothetical protein